MDTALTMLVRANLFHAAHAAIPDWSTFPWHRDREGNIQAHKPWSSQALAIDVFGTIEQSPERDLILDRLAIELDLPPGGPWKVELEWTDPANSLRERKRTQVDAAAFGSRAAILFECKFTEPGGGAAKSPLVMACGSARPNIGCSRTL
jgi:hypothetical protein